MALTAKEFVAKHGFTGTPAGERMAADLKALLVEAWDEGYDDGAEGATGGWAKHETENPYKED